MDNIISKYCSKEWNEFVNFHKKEISYKPKAVIFNEGDETLGIYIIRNGKVKVMTTDLDGKQRLIRLASDGDILGHRGFWGNWKYPITAIALEKTQMTFIPLNVFNQVVKANIDLCFYLVTFFAEELRRSEEKMMQLPVRNRVAKALLLNYEAFGFKSESNNELSYTISRKDIAGVAGTTYETVIRELADMNENKIIKIIGKQIAIRDLKKLEKRVTTVAAH